MEKYEYINNVIDEDTGKELRYCQLCKHTKYKETQKKYFANGLGILAQGTGIHVDITATMIFIAKYQVSKERLKEVMYGRIVVDYWPQKADSH